MKEKIPCRCGKEGAQCMIHNPPFPIFTKMKSLPQIKDDILKSFDLKFGTDGPEKNSDSLGRRAGCDDCQGNIEERTEHRDFLSSALTQAIESAFEAIELPQFIPNFAKPIYCKYHIPCPECQNKVRDSALSEVEAKKRAFLGK